MCTAIYVSSSAPFADSERIHVVPSTPPKDVYQPDINEGGFVGFALNMLRWAEGKLLSQGVDPLLAYCWASAIYQDILSRWFANESATDFALNLTIPSTAPVRTILSGVGLGTDQELIVYVSLRADVCGKHKFFMA